MDNQGGGGACMMMGYGDSHTTNIGTASSNGQLLCPTMLMMMPPPLPPITSSHSHPISDQHNINHNHNHNDSNNNTLFLPLPLPPPTNTTTNTTGCYFMMDSQNNHHHHHHHNSSVNGSGSSSSTFSPSSVVKAKIMSHPLYHRLLSAYANCQKIGAPPEVVARLEEACASLTAGARTTSSGAGEDPALDQFMEAYLEMLTKYELELSKPFKEAMLFLSRIESQFKSLTLTGPYISSDSHMSTANQQIRRDFLPKEYWVQSWEEDEFTNEDGEHLEEETLMQDENKFPTSEAKEIEETKAEQEFKAFKNDKLTNGEEPVEKIEESENTDGDDNAQYEEMEDESIDKDVRVHGGQNVSNSGMTFDVSLREENVVRSFPLYSLSNFEEESNDYFLMAKNDVIVPQEYVAKVDVLKTYFIENHPGELFFMTRKDNDFVEGRTSYYPQLGVENLLSDTGWVNMEMFFDLEELLEMSRENGHDPICTQVTKKCQRCNKKMCHMQYTSKEMAKKIVALDGIGDFISSAACGEALDRNGSSEEEVDVNNNLIDPQAEDRELKGQLLRKYSGYLGSLKQEFMKKRKKGKLPKEARQQLLDWWSRHYKWPYPSESQKLALAESTGLDQKQINNWFINQRKRHWKPSEDMQFVVMDAAHPHYYVDNVLGNPFPMDISPALL
ncbi:LOW QUALITY PROTEIN: hypothetical protein RJ640_005687 [Escallonia rubra]|uniref:Uncharacterized protein n=1 Tax=Escallonia rubra TaxID=112253 RepID=A0AA88SJ94_9ASTE|nr:LOW QUALITY PROTEIN: hypothetical protein RJ640_005687 [Escallonia rubra]